MSHYAECAEPDEDYIPPRVKLSDDTFIFVDGKWVNEACHQPPFPSHQKHFFKKTQNEWTLWEENKALWKENKALRIENKTLREENKALQCLRTQNKAIQVIYDETLQQVLQKENKPFPIFRDRAIGSQVNRDNMALQVVRDKNRALQVFQKENKAIPIFRKENKDAPIQEKSKEGGSDFQEESKAAPATDEDMVGPALQKDSEAVEEIREESTADPVQKGNHIASAIQEENVALQAILNLNQILQTHLKENFSILEEKKNIQVLQEETKRFQEENNKLKLQLAVVKGTMSEVMAHMEMLQKELSDLSATKYDEMRKQNSCW
ncbi:protein chibby homolog 2 [Alligator mississippiensis]|uniref:Spermatid-associated protein n=1 Tax=Alligator mississippiensis TaxID=8496 RepID=A0A151MHM2_ALLMI|nr:protein chibby homolog 2 [Alligator mississippiensis]KYO24004.1 spermatid-associated protein [Alligator mississippiensis]